MAMGITLAENRVDLAGDRLFVEDRGIRRVPRRCLGPADRHQGRHRAALEGVRERLPGGFKRLNGAGAHRVRLPCRAPVVRGASRQRFTRLHADSVRADERPGILARDSQPRRPAGRRAVPRHARVERSALCRAVSVSVHGPAEAGHHVRLETPTYRRLKDACVDNASVHGPYRDRALCWPSWCHPTSVPSAWSWRPAPSRSSSY